jgi:hypothetical protein
MRKRIVFSQWCEKKGHLHNKSHTVGGLGPLGCDLAQSVRTDVAVKLLTLFRHPMMLHPAPIPTVAMVIMSVDRVSLSAIISKREGM